MDVSTTSRPATGPADRRLRRRGFRGLRRQPRRAHRRRRPRRGDRHGRAPAGRADRRRAHRRRRPRLGAGRVRRPPRRHRPRRPRRAGSTSCARPAIAVRDAAWVGRRLRRPLLGDVAALPLRRLERPGAEPAARRAGVVRAAAAGPLGDAGGLRPADRRARLLLVLPAPQAATRADGERRRARRWSRRVLSARWRELDDPAHLRFEIRATAFCHQMVRSIVGTLVDVGLGKASPGDVRGHPRRPRPRGRRPGRPAPRPRAVGGRLPPVTYSRVTADDDGPPHPRRPARRAGRDRGPPAGRPGTASGAPAPPSSTPCARQRGAFTADELAAAVPDVHVSTVYRTLALLEEIGAVRHVHLSHGPALYEQRGRRPSVRHLVCEVCDRHVAVPLDVFDAVRDRLAGSSASCSRARTSPSSAAASTAPTR